VSIRLLIDWSQVRSLPRPPFISPLTKDRSTNVVRLHLRQLLNALPRGCDAGSPSCASLNPHNGPMRMQPSISREDTSGLHLPHRCTGLLKYLNHVRAKENLANGGSNSAPRAIDVHNARYGLAPSRQHDTRQLPDMPPQPYGSGAFSSSRPGIRSTANRHRAGTSEYSLHSPFFPPKYSCTRSPCIASACLPCCSSTPISVSPC